MLHDDYSTVVTVVQGETHAFRLHPSTTPFAQLVYLLPTSSFNVHSSQISSSTFRIVHFRYWSHMYKKLVYEIQ